MITQDELKNLLSYNKDTGLFIRSKYVKNSKFKIGSIAGNLEVSGYIRIKINNIKYLAHRLAWFYVFGYWPKELDHINGIKSDNRLSNLRDINKSLNQQNQRFPSKNNTTGYLGVYKGNTKFTSSISINNKSIYLGRFNTAEEAHLAYLTAKRKLHITCTI